MEFLHAIGEIIKLGGIAIIILILYVMIFGVKGTRIISPISAVICIAATVGMDLILRQSNDDSIYLIVHAILPGVISYFVGGMLYKEVSLLGQIIGTVLAFAVVFLLTLLLNKFLYIVVSIALFLLFSPLYTSLFCALFGETDDNKRAYELIDKAKSSYLSDSEIYELKKCNRNVNDYELRRATEMAIERQNRFSNEKTPTDDF